MKKAQIEKQRNIRQRDLDRITCKSLIYHVIICFVIMIVALCFVVNERTEGIEDIVESQHETTKPQTVPTIQTNSNSSNINVKDEFDVIVYPEFTYSKDWDYEDSYLLAKIAMAEAEGRSTQTKTLIVMTVLNRVWSDEFPDTIKEVIFQEYKGVYQFTPIANGRWDRVEPNDDCWEAVQIVMEAKYDYSGGALYFESCSNPDNWHSRNLEFLYESDGMRFYK